MSMSTPKCSSIFQVISDFYIVEHDNSLFILNTLLLSVQPKLCILTIISSCGVILILLSAKILKSLKINIIFNYTGDIHPTSKKKNNVNNIHYTEITMVKILVCTSLDCKKLCQGVFWNIAKKMDFEIIASCGTFEKFYKLSSLVKWKQEHLP